MFFVMPCSCRRRFVCLLPDGARRVARCRLVTPVSCRCAESAAFARVSPKSRCQPNLALADLLRTPRAHRIRQHGPEARSAPSCSSALRGVSSQSARQKKEKKKSLQNPPTPPVSSRIRGINVEIVARRCSSTSEMKYLLLKVEKRCQTTIEKILKSIVDERRSPGH